MIQKHTVTFTIEVLPEFPFFPPRHVRTSLAVMGGLTDGNCRVRKMHGRLSNLSIVTRT